LQSRWPKRSANPRASAGRDVIQFHDNRKVTVDAVDSILTGAKLSGFKVVQIVPAAAFAPKAEYVMATARPAPVPVVAASSGVSHHPVEIARRRVRAYDDGDNGLAAPPDAGLKKNKLKPINGCGSACAQ
jgi:hypothetical protein